MSFIFLFLYNFSYQVHYTEKNIENIIDYCENEIKEQFLIQSSTIDPILEREFLFLALYKNLFNEYYNEISNFIIVNLPILLNFYIFIFYTNQGTECTKVSHKILSIYNQTIIIRTKNNAYNIEIENLCRFYIMKDKPSKKYIFKKFLTNFLQKLFLIQKTINYMLSITITDRCFVVFTDIPSRNFQKTNFMFISLFLQSLTPDNEYLHILIINKHQINIHYNEKDLQKGILEYSFSNELYAIIANFSFSRSKIDMNSLKKNYKQIITIDLTKKVVILTTDKPVFKIFNQKISVISSNKTFIGTKPDTVSIAYSSSNLSLSLMYKYSNIKVPSNNQICIFIFKILTKNNMLQEFNFIYDEHTRELHNIFLKTDMLNEFSNGWVLEEKMAYFLLRLKKIRNSKFYIEFFRNT